MAISGEQLWNVVPQISPSFDVDFAICSHLERGGQGRGRNESP